MDKIMEPGIYDLTMSEYHSDICSDISISSGDLVAIGQNPAKWYAHHWSNPEPFEKEDKQYFRFGRAAHTIVVGGEVFEDLYEIRPEEYDSYRTKASKEWRDMVVEDGRTPLTPDEMKTILAMADAISKSPEALAVFSQGQPERSLIWQRDGVWLKARPDVIPHQDSRIIIDYKTVASVDPRKIRMSIVDNGWIQKLANVTDGMINCTDTKAKSLEDFDYLLICQEKKPPFEVAIVTIEACDIADMFRLNQRVIQEFKESRLSGEWRGQNDGFVEYRTEEWMLNKMSARYGGVNGLPQLDVNFG